VISIVIPNWNGKDLIKNCLASLMKQTYKDFEVIVADNGSTDDSVELIEKDYPETKIVQMGTNKGFSIPVNKAIRNARGEYIALLNNDVEVDPNWLQELNGALERNLEVGFCSSKMLFMKRRDIINEICHSFRIDGRSEPTGLEEKDCGQYEEEKLIFGACGGAAIYRRSMLKEIGLFDEDYFMYAEDVDLDFRAQLAGYKCLYVPTAIVYHKSMGTAGPLTYAYFTTKNSLNVLVKDMPLLLLLKYLPYIFWGQYKQAKVYATKGMIYPLIMGKLGALRQIAKMLLKRNVIQGKRKVSLKYLESIFKKEI